MPPSHCYFGGYPSVAVAVDDPRNQAQAERGDSPESNRVRSTGTCSMSARYVVEVGPEEGADKVFVRE